MLHENRQKIIEIKKAVKNKCDFSHFCLFLFFSCSSLLVPYSCIIIYSINNLVGNDPNFFVQQDERLLFLSLNSLCVTHALCKVDYGNVIDWIWSGMPLYLPLLKCFLIFPSYAISCWNVFLPLHWHGRKQRKELLFPGKWWKLIETEDMRLTSHQHLGNCYLPSKQYFFGLCFFFHVCLEFYLNWFNTVANIV